MLGVSADARTKYPCFFLSSFTDASFRLLFFFFPIIGSILVLLLLPLLLLIHQKGSPSHTRSLLEQSLEIFVILLYFFFFFAFVMSFLYRFVWAPHCTLYYFFILIKVDIILFYVFFIFCNSYAVNGCAIIWFFFLLFWTILRAETLLRKRYLYELIETIRHNNADPKK